MLWLSSALLATVIGPLTVQAASVHYDLSLAAGKIAPDGFKRSASLVNGKFPGPILKANKGDKLTVNVHNNLADPTMRRSTSIHWHGILQARNAEDDGASFVTQCPIAPGHSYNYALALGDQAGTFWYHSHLGAQYVDGIRGPLVIYDPNDPQKHLYDVDDESTVITLDDWFHKPAPTLEADWHAGGSEPIQDSGLVNGVGRYHGGPAVKWARVNVKHGKRYRFRILSMAAGGQFEFAIAKHSMTVIEADGIAHEPYTVDSIPVLAGQRYSVIVTANQTIDNYWITAPQTFQFTAFNPANPNFNGTDVFAVLHYDKAPDADPTAPQPTGLAPGGVEFEEFNLKPLVNPGAPGGDSTPSRVFNFNLNFTTPNDDVWVINGIQYQPPTIPTLLNILSNGFTNESQFGPNEDTFVLQRNDIVEISFFGFPNHPFHLHGHAFDVIQSQSGPPNYVNPPRRDVVATGDTLTNPNAPPVRIRFKADNPGPWFLHCHIEWHFSAGLAAVFAEDPTGIQRGPQSVHTDPAWEQLCRTYNALDPSLQ